MERERFKQAFEKAVELAKTLAQRKHPDLPTEVPVLFDISTPQLEPGEKFKFLGGRILTREDLVALSAVNVRKLLWIDGRVPTWINLAVDRLEAGALYLTVYYSKELAERDGPWRHAREGNPPFHVLGPKEGNDES
jgi:hypothetical protein